MRLPAALAAALLLAAAPSGPPGARALPADVCAAMPGSRVDSILAQHGVALKVAGVSGSSASCTYRFSDPSVHLMIDVVDAGSAAEASAALQTLRASLAGARSLAGVGDQAFIYDEGPYG